MEKFIYLFLHLIFPLILVFDFAFRKSKSKMGLCVRATLVIAILGFLYLWGQWPLVGSYYLRYFLVIMILYMIGLSVLRLRSVRSLWPKGVFKYILTGLTGLLALGCIYMFYGAYSGSDYHEEGVELSFPLKNGMFYIASGGSNKILNNHVRDYPNAQQFALDINKLGTNRGVSKKILSKERTEHYIFADTVFCPCNGTILEIKDGVKDNTGVSMDVESEDGTGNFVNIDCGGVLVFIPHLKLHEIFVLEDMKVKEDTPLGLIGLSGFTQEPHLHIQAARYNSDSVLVGIPMKFRGDFLSRNDLFSN